MSWVNQAVLRLKPGDFAKLRDVMAKTLAASSRKTEILKTRAIFNFAFKNELIDRPVRFGTEFNPPSKKVLKRERQTFRQANGDRMFEAHELRTMLDAAPAQAKVMILLGINCGFGNNDIATLPLTAIDLDLGWVEHPRPKTGADRRCPLWPETIEALREVVAKRQTPKDDADKNLVFITIYGNRWVRLTKNSGWTDSITVLMRELLEKLGLKRPGRNFYALRHAFETVAGETTDQVAVDHIMGHIRDDMASVYRERISDERLKAVTDHVRQWLFGDDPDPEAETD